MEIPTKKTWALKKVEGCYLVPNQEKYQLQKVYSIKTRAEIISNTVKLFPYERPILETSTAELTKNLTNRSTGRKNRQQIGIHPGANRAHHSQEHAITSSEGVKYKIHRLTHHIHPSHNSKGAHSNSYS